MVLLPTGNRVAVKRWGKGRPVLCLHATGHGSGDFAALAERVSHRYEILALDWPGQGRSPPDAGPVSASHYAKVAMSVSEALQLDRPILLGNSIGGAAALIAAHKDPGRFSGLILCNSGGLAPVNALARVAIKAMVAFFDAGTRGARWYDRAFAGYYRRLVLPGKPARRQRERIIAAGSDLAPLLAEAWRSFARPEADLRAMVPEICLPVWLAWARSDRLVSWGRSRAAAQRFPDKVISLFAGGHAAFLEDPDAFAAGFLEFAKRLLPAEPGHGRS